MLRAMQERGAVGDDGTSECAMISMQMRCVQLLGKWRTESECTWMP
jgi:hypothetical protein